MTLTCEDYVRGVYYLQTMRGSAKASDLATRLNVSKNTASQMVQKLSKKGFLKHQPYGVIDMTDKGRALAKKLTYRHRLIETFLNEVLGVSSEKVHQEACRLEHDFSKESFHGLEKLVGKHSLCPHGQPLKM